jgi:hypothetical protein
MDDVYLMKLILGMIYCGWAGLATFLDFWMVGPVKGTWLTDRSVDRKGAKHGKDMVDFWGAKVQSKQNTFEWYICMHYI